MRAGPSRRGKRRLPAHDRNEVHAELSAPVGALEDSPRRQPWEKATPTRSPVRGERNIRQRTFFRPSGAEKRFGACFPTADAVGYLLTPFQG